MAEQRKVAPVDKYKMPLPIVVLPRKGRGQRTNNHHPNFNAKRPELRNLAGRALRAARIQTVPAPAHDEFHDVFCQPDFSDLINEAVPGQHVFERLPLYHASYVPTVGIDPFRDDPTEFVKLDPSRRARLGSDMELDGKFVDGSYRLSEHIGNFMFSFIIDNFINESDLENIDVLRLKKNKQARKVRGVMRRAVNDASSLAQPMYKSARQDRKTTRLRHCMHASEVVVDLLNRAYTNHAAYEVFKQEVNKRIDLLS